MVFRRTGGEDQRDDVIEEEEDGLNIISGDDDEDDEAVDLFEEGEPCQVCGAEDGRFAMDPSCRGAYDGEPVLFGPNCLGGGLADAYKALEGVAIIVEPFSSYSAHYYYRLDEMPAYGFVREDVEAISWLLLTIGDACARCGEQSHFAWLTPKFIDQKLPEDRPVFRNLDKDIEHLCGACASSALAGAYANLKLPMMTVELPRGAMGIMMPTGD